MSDKLTQNQFEEQIRQSYGVPEASAGFKKHLEGELMRRAELKRAQTVRQAPRWRFAQAAAAAVLLLALFLTAVPQGRALAESIGHLFKVAAVTEIPIEDPAIFATPTFAPGFAITLAPVVTAAPTSAPAPVQSNMPDDVRAVCEDDPYGYACKIYWAEKRVGFDIREFPIDPIDMRLREVQVGENKNVYIRYERVGGGTFLIFNQGLGEELNSGGMGIPPEAIQPVMVGEYPGEYAEGSYIVLNGAKAFSWQADASRYTLRWREDDRWYEIQYWGCVGREDYCNAEGLVQLALTLVDRPLPETGPRADYLKSVVEAKQISGLDLLEPAILPESFMFSYGTFNAEIGQVMLSYQPVGYPPMVAEVSIRQQPGDTLPMPPPEEKFDTVEVHGNPAIYQSSGPFSHWLTWQENGKIITLAMVSSDLWYGGTFTREQVLEIARSMR